VVVCASYFWTAFAKKTYLLVCEKSQTSADYLFTGNTIYVYWDVWMCEHYELLVSQYHYHRWL